MHPLPTNQTCLNQGVAGYKTFLQKGVIELLSTTCNSLICLRFVFKQTRKVALNSFAAILYKILRVIFFISFTTNSQVTKSFLKSFFELRVLSIKLSDNLMEICVFSYPNLNYQVSTRRKHSKINDLTTTLKLLL